MVVATMVVAPLGTPGVLLWAKLRDRHHVNLVSDHSFGYDVRC